MNPVFVFLVFLVTTVLWFLLSFAFLPLGKFVTRIWTDAKDEMNKDDEDEDEKEND